MLNENVLLKPNNINAWLNLRYQQILSPYSLTFSNFWTIHVKEQQSLCRHPILELRTL